MIRLFLTNSLLIGLALTAIFTPDAAFWPGLVCLPWGLFVMIQALIRHIRYWRDMSRNRIPVFNLRIGWKPAPRTAHTSR